MPAQPAAGASLLRQVRRAAREAGIDAVGVTDVAPFTQARRALAERKAAGLHGGMWFTYGRPERSTAPASLLPGARSIVACARRYQPPLGEAPGSGGDGPAEPCGAVAAYAADDAYGALRAGLEQICEMLRGRGFAALAVADDNRLVDRAAAARAGLGWLGRNTMLLSAELGTWTVLGSVVTTALLPTSPQMPADGCGSCRRCACACPTGALDTDGVLDANRCLAWLVQAPGVFPAEHRVALGDRLYGCDDCQTVCPFNDAASAAASTAPAPPASTVSTVSTVSTAPVGSAGPVRGSAVSIVELLRRSDDELMAGFGHWYIPRRRPEYLRRNALVVLGNIGDPDSPEVGEVLAESLASPSAVVAGHAVWAARRLGRSDLIAAPLVDGLGAGDAGPLVRAELARRVPRARSAA